MLSHLFNFALCAAAVAVLAFGIAGLLTGQMHPLVLAAAAVLPVVLLIGARRAAGAGAVR
ncbi:hypothetical protein [Nocardiopsis halophila]|uniref:hypothetical protein n=1 Tax=Nocardiopsis halophila TaxID=141692 RepID=UPI0003475C9C|nr:hypothetical protein [Nocardiopsis halophila]